MYNMVVGRTRVFRVRDIVLPSLFVLVGLLSISVSVAGCRGGSAIDDHNSTQMPTRSIEDVLETHTDSLMAIRGVEGVGQGKCDGEPCIRVFVSEETSDVKAEVPDTIEGYPVDVEGTGPFRTRDR